MDLLPTPEQEEIVSSIRAVLAGQYTVGEPPTAALAEAAAQQGWAGLALPEADGGVGYTVVEECLLFAELGYHCVPGNFLATALAATIAAEASDSALVERILTGTTTVALAQRFGPTQIALEDGDDADLALVVLEDRTTLMRVADLGGLSAIAPFDTLVPISLAADPPSAAATLTAEDPGGLALRGSLLVAAELAGMARAVTDQSVSYGHDREQFGQPIGGFQAVKHRCADMATAAEAAECQVRYASLALRDARPDAPFHVHAARAVAARAAIDNAQVNIQNHGGIGFTWEHTAHRYVTRARIRSLAFGSPARGLAALLEASAPQ